MNVEEVIAPCVHDLLGGEVLLDEEDQEKVWEMRYRQINDYRISERESPLL